jgi:hypothetical protein
VTNQDSPPREADELYELYAKPLERDHLGEYVAVSYDGRVLLDRELYSLVVKASEVFGSRNHIFKVGERAVGKWR